MEKTDFDRKLNLKRKKGHDYYWCHLFKFPALKKHFNYHMLIMLVEFIYRENTIINHHKTPEFKMYGIHSNLSCSYVLSLTVVFPIKCYLIFPP